MNILSSSLFLSVAVLSGTAGATTVHNVPADFATVQAAVDSAAPGDVIQIAPGRYVEHVVITTPGITINGIKIDGFKVLIDGSYSGPCMVVQADNVTLQSLAFDNGGPATSDGTQAAGGLLITGSGEHILRCLARGCAGVGIKLVGNGEIVDSTTIACQGPGLVVDSGNAAGPTTRLSHNDVFHSSEGFVLVGGPFDSDHNRAIGNTGDGIRVELSADGASGSPQAGSSTFSHESATGNHGTGLVVVDDFGGVGLVEHSDLSQNGLGLDATETVAGLKLDDIDAMDNSVGGVVLHTVGAEFSNSRVWRNTGFGIVVESAGGAADGNNTVRGSKIQANAGDGVHVTSGANTIRDNYIKDSYGDGLQIMAGADRNTVSYNQVLNSHNDGLDNWGTNTVITGNNCFNNAGTDLAGIGDGNGTVDPASTGNTAEDLTGLTSMQQLELATILP